MKYGNPPHGICRGAGLSWGGVGKCVGSSPWVGRRGYRGASSPRCETMHLGKRKKQEVTVVLRHRAVRSCTPERGKTRNYSGASSPRCEVMHPGKRKKQEVTVVLRHHGVRSCTPEKEKASNFRGGWPPRKPAWHPGKGKSK